MKLSIPQPDLLDALNRVRGVVESTNVIPIWSCVRLDADGNVLSVTARDHTLSATVRMTDVDIDEGGAVAVEAKALYEFVRRINPDVGVTLETKDNKLVVRSGRSRAGLLMFNADDFQFIDFAEDGSAFSLSADQVKHLIVEPVVAASSEETRYYLCGVALHAVDGQLRGVATDGSVLIKHVEDLPAGCDLAEAIIIPTKTIGIIAKNLGEDDVDVHAGNGKVRFALPNVEIVSCLVQGKYPDYDRVIPHSPKNPAVFDRAEAMTVIERVACLTSDGLKPVKLSGDDGAIAVTTARASSDHEADDRIDAEFDGKLPEVGFASKKVGIAIGAMKGAKVRMFFDGDRGPSSLIDPERPDDVRVLMPVRV